MIDLTERYELIKAISEIERTTQQTKTNQIIHP